MLCKPRFIRLLCRLLHGVRSRLRLNLPLLLICCLFCQPLLLCMQPRASRQHRPRKQRHAQRCMSVRRASATFRCSYV